jgi:hypothetical protein
MELTLDPVLPSIRRNVGAVVGAGLLAEVAAAAAEHYD